jgi:hypothetical protein
MLGLVAITGAASFLQPVAASINTKTPITQNLKLISHFINPKNIFKGTLSNCKIRAKISVLFQKVSILLFTLRQKGQSRGIHTQNYQYLSVKTNVSHHTVARRWPAGQFL